MEVRTVTPVYERPPGLFTEHTDKFIVVDDNDMDSDTDAESDMSLFSRSFLHRVNDRVRKIQDQYPQKMQHKTATNILQCGECLCLRHWKHLYSWERITQKIHIPLRIQEKFQMFDISEKLITEQSIDEYNQMG